MFKISCLVEDKKLPMVLHALDGLVVDMEAPLPVKGYPSAEPEPAPVAPIAERAFVPGTKPAKQERARHKRKHIAGLREMTKKGQALTVPDIKVLIEKLGWMPTSYTYAISEAIKAKVLQRVGVGQYKVL